MQFHLNKQPDITDRELVKSQIKAFNDAHSPAHKRLRKTGKQVFNVTITHGNGEVIGGLLGHTYWGWLSIDDLWVEETHREKGLGRRLITMAEREAMRRGCGHAHVKTWSFQARGFYERMGYNVVGELADYPEGESLYWMRKDLEE